MSKQFDGMRKVMAVRDITLHIAMGEMVAIVGPSGSGKSTLLNLIGTLDRPTSGAIRIGDQETGRMGDAALTRLRREQIGFVFQFFNLLPSLNCLENVGLPLHLCGRPARQVRERAAELLDSFGLSKRLEHLPDELSGGERQRVAIARALALDPAIVLADEPTGNLDSETGAEVLTVIDDLHQRLGKTVLLVTHDEGVAKSASRRVVLRDGRIVEDRRQ